MSLYTWGAIFDWDGVILDSSRHHEEAWKRLSQETGYTLSPEHFKRGFGMKNEKIIPEILGWTSSLLQIQKLSIRKEKLYRQVVQEWGIAPLPGVKKWLEILCNAKIPCVIASSTHRLNITKLLPLLGLQTCFPNIISAEDVTHGKPHPEVFLLAAKKISKRPDNCVVFEDAIAGIMAAHAAGMKVIAVTTTHSSTKLLEADRVVRQLDELTAKEVSRLVNHPDPIS